MEQAAKARNSKFSDTWLYRLDRFANQVKGAAQSRLREVSGMSFSQFLVLMALVEQDGLKQSAIARYVGVTPAVITKQIDQLAGQGLVQLSPAHNDRRANVVRLTTSGRSLARNCAQAVLKVLEADVQMADHYQQKLHHLLKDL